MSMPSLALPVRPSAGVRTCLSIHSSASVVLRTNDCLTIGINSVLFLISVALTLYRLQQSHALRVPQLPMIGLTCALFLCCTAHFALEFNHFYIVLVRQ